MKWFNPKNQKKPKSTPGVDIGSKNWKTGPVRPYDAWEEDHESRQSGSHGVLFVILIFLTALLFARASFVRSEPVALTQTDWDVQDIESETALPLNAWGEYAEKDPGIVTGEDLSLESAAYMVTQTSDNGAMDSCALEDCATGGGFNGVTTLKAGTKVTGTGSGADIILTSSASTEEFSLDLLGAYDAAASSGIVVAGNTAYLADGNQGLIIIDISSPSSPALLGAYDTSGKALNVTVNGNTAYVADHTAGLQIIDVTTPSSPSLTGTYNTSGKAYDVAVLGNYVYVADHSNGLVIIDISNPASPALAATYATSKNALGVVVSGNYAYVAESGNAGLEIINIATPTSPYLAGSLSTAASANGGIFKNGDNVYVTIGSGGFEVINVASPSSPASVNVVGASGSVMDIAVEGSYAYVAIGASGLAVIDISDPASPVVLGTYDTSGTALAIAANNGKAYIADDIEGLQIVQSSQGSAYFAAGTFESAVMDLGSSIYDIDALIADVTVPAGALPVGLEIPANDAGLLALWHMDASDTAETSVADAAGSKDGVMHAAPAGTNATKAAMWDERGNIGTSTYTALEFDGTDDYVSIGTSITGIKTVMFWINHGNPSSGDQIMEFNGSQSISIAAGTGYITTTGITSPAIYVDGNLQSAALSAGWHHVAVTTETAIVGSNINLGRVVTGYFNGLLDEVALYDHTVSANKVRKNYLGTGVKFQIAASHCMNGASNAPSCSLNAGWGDSDTPFIGADGTDQSYLSGPVLLYHFDEGSGTNITDASGYGHDATVIVGASGDQKAAATAWTNGALGALSNLGGQSLAFDGTDDYVSAGDIQADVKSIEMWINHSSNSFGGVILQLNAGQAIVIAPSGKVVASGFDLPVIYVDGDSGSSALTAGWHHVVVMTASPVAASDVTIGRVDGQYMTGSIDEVTMYDRVLSAKEIRARYNNGDAVAGALFGSLDASLDGKRYVKYKAQMNSSSAYYGPQVHAVTVGVSAVPSGAGLVSSVFDTGDPNSFVTDIAWSESLKGHDVRLQVGTSADGMDWNYCGIFYCSTDDWMDFSADIGNYYTKSSGNIPNNQSRNADSDQYIRYKIWLMSSDGKGTPRADDITIRYDAAHLEMFAPDGESGEYTPIAGVPFNIVIKVMDSSDKVINHHDGSRTVKITASKPQLDTQSCASSFNKNGHTEFTRNAVFFSGTATIYDVLLCDDKGNEGFTIGAVEVIGGALESTADLTIKDIVSPDETVEQTLYWDPITDCAGFDHYEVWYGLTANVALGIGAKWDDTDDPALGACATSQTTIPNLQAYTKYYFHLYAVDTDGNAVSLGVSESGEIDEPVTMEDMIEAIDENIPEGTKLYDVVIKLGDNHHSDLEEDTRGSWKHGDVVAVVLNGHEWTDNEKASFLITQMYLTEQDVADLLRPETLEDGMIIKRRVNKVQMEALGLTEEDAKYDLKKRAVRDQLRGKRLKKDMAVMEKKAR